MVCSIRIDGWGSMLGKTSYKNCTPTHLGNLVRAWAALATFSLVNDVLIRAATYLALHGMLSWVFFDTQWMSMKWEVFAICQPCDNPPHCARCLCAASSASSRILLQAYEGAVLWFFSFSFSFRNLSGLAVSHCYCIWIHYWLRCSDNGFTCPWKCESCLILFGERVSDEFLGVRESRLTEKDCHIRSAIRGISRPRQLAKSC